MNCSVKPEPLAEAATGFSAGCCRESVGKRGVDGLKPRMGESSKQCKELLSETAQPGSGNIRRYSIFASNVYWETGNRNGRVHDWG